MLSRVQVLCGLLVLGLMFPGSAFGQTPDSSRAWHADAWIPIVEQRGVRIA